MPTEEEYTAISETADDLVAEGRTDEARDLLTQGLEKARAAGDEPFVLFFGGELAYLGHSLQQALQLQKQASQSKPNASLILRRVGLILNNMGRHREALDWIDKALKLKPDDYRALRERGVALAHMGGDEETLELHRKALESYEKVLTTAPHDIRTQRKKAITLWFLGRETEAIAGLRRCLQTNPNDEEARAWLATFVVPVEAMRIVAEVEEQRRRQEQERLRAQHRARERQIKLDAWRTLSGRSAHRIGNQLFASRGALRTLKELNHPDTAEAVSDLEAGLDRIRQIVQEFQTFSRDEPLKQRPTEIGPLLKDVVRRYTKLAEGVEVSAEVADELPRCMLDRERMDQALGELLENAIHHTPGGGKIRVTVNVVDLPTGDRVRIAVEDTGKGVPQKDKVLIFQPFISTRPGGSGLGLAIVQQIIENHGGTIRETGKPGEGARFEMDFPALTDQETKP